MSERSGGLDAYRGKRNFRRTPEPSGAAAAKRDGAEPEWVVQKHAASHLHFDLRLECGGVMLSWAVPKGPSLDPEVRRLAVEVEAHPLEYNQFEGTIPRGEYGGGTVMIWDRGTYTAEGRRPGETDEQAVRRGFRSGRISFTLRGERLRGSFSLIRTRRAEGEERAQWLLAKRDDRYADSGVDVVGEHATSVVSGRTMEEIAAGKGGRRVWRSNRSAPASADRQASAAPSPALPSGLCPMLARSAAEPPEGEGWTFEPKYDGIRVLAFATEGGGLLVTRNGNDKSAQFPEIAEALQALAADLGEPVVLDGEVVALQQGRIVRFEALQSRMHLTQGSRVSQLRTSQPVALVAFDLLLVGDEVLLGEPWSERRARLEEALVGRTNDRLLLGETTPRRERLQRRAEAHGWEGLIAKRVNAPYRPGSRTGDWLKLKLEHQQEFVIGGWTEPRNSREHLGALLLGYYRDGKLEYAGHTGTGFTREALRDVGAKLRRLERKTSPFTTRPRTNEPAHWVTPKLVAEVRFNEWTSEGKLRQPVFLGLRTDREPRSVVRESASPPADPAAAAPPKPAAAPARKGGTRAKRRREPPAVRRLAEIESDSGSGAVPLDDDGLLEVSNLDKCFFPEAGVTKGDLLRYYASMAPYILPWIRDRPLVLKRYPGGVDRDAFYQQAAPDEVPVGVRVERVGTGGEARRRLVGGNLATLLYTVQLGAISYDPWHSRVGHLEAADYSIVDLDPGPGASFSRVVDVALWVREELDRLGLHGAVKTSGSTGLHVYLPLPQGTPLEAATLVAQIVATRVTRRHPEAATVERLTRRRPSGTVYVDYLQNILGKTVAGVYAVRARPTATVSTPLRWDELGPGLSPLDFTLRSVPERLQSEGDLWGAAMATPNLLETLFERGAA